MRWILIPVVVLSAGIGASGAVAAVAVPILSPTSDPYYHQQGGMRNTEGFGHTKPKTIFYGGDPTGLVCDIHWQTWGAKVARGTGVAWYVSGNESVNEGHQAKATVIASKLGTFNGRPAYTKLKWSFPDSGKDRSTVRCV